MGLNGGTRGGLQLFPTYSHAGDEENKSGGFVDRAVERAVEWAGTYFPLGTRASSDKGILDIVMGSLDSSMPPGEFYPSIAMDASYAGRQRRREPRSNQWRRH
ncbi:hypothetical protein R1flu_015523 [Riccia fluitans]|uniref:Uncharacterized protein n=1 Tax=Riccia fluitans TaxID=41844 RepID=A0ABD1YMB7_9MARC